MRTRISKEDYSKLTEIEKIERKQAQRRLYEARRIRNRMYSKK